MTNGRYKLFRQRRNLVQSDIRIKAYYRSNPDFKNSGYGFQTVEKNFSERISKNPSFCKSWISEGELRLGNKAFTIHYFWNHVIVDSLQAALTIPDKKHIQYFQNRLGLDRFVWSRLRSYKIQYTKLKLPVSQKFEASSWAGAGPMHIRIHGFHGVGEWGASNSLSEPGSSWIVTHSGRTGP